MMSDSSDVFHLIENVLSLSRVQHRNSIEEPVIAQNTRGFVETEPEEKEDALFEEWRSTFLDEVESVTGKRLEELEKMVGYSLRTLYEQTDSLDEAIQRFLRELETPKIHRKKASNFREWSRDVDALLVDQGGPSLQELRDSGFMSASSLYTFFLEHRIPEDAVEHLSVGETSSDSMSLDEIADFHRWIADLDLDAEENEDEEDAWEEDEEEESKKESVPPGMDGIFEDVQRSMQKDSHVPSHNIENLISQVMVKNEKPSPKDELAQQIIPGMLDIVEEDIDVTGSADIMEQASQALRGVVGVPEKGRAHE